MSYHETPGYYCVADGVEEPPPSEECTEGRLFLDADRLVCGAGRMGGNGYADTLDEYSGSTVRRAFGNRFDPQEFGLDEATRREGTITVPRSAIPSNTGVCRCSSYAPRASARSESIVIRTTFDGS